MNKPFTLVWWLRVYQAYSVYLGRLVEEQEYYKGKGRDEMLLAGSRAMKHLKEVAEWIEQRIINKYGENQ